MTPYVTEPANISYAYPSSIAIKNNKIITAPNTASMRCVPTHVLYHHDREWPKSLACSLPKCQITKTQNAPSSHYTKKCGLRAVNDKTLEVSCHHTSLGWGLNPLQIPDVMMSCRVVTAKTLSNPPFQVCCAFLIQCLTAELSPPRY